MRTYALENRGRAPLYEYLYRCIRGDILDGTLTAGERLPSKRALAEHLHISVMTVEGAYQQLEAEGYVYTQPKRGFFVAEVERPRPAVPAPPAPEAPPEAPVWRLDLKSNQVDASRFPAAAWARLTRQVLSEDGEALLPAEALRLHRDGALLTARLTENGRETELRLLLHGGEASA